jgi:copper chaperone CopZ
MTCHKCIGRVERALKALPGVLSASADLTAARARVEGSADVGELLAALQQAGYPACHITGISTGITGIAAGITGTKDSTEAKSRAAAAIDCDATSIGVVSKAKGGGVGHGIHPLVSPPLSMTLPPPTDCPPAEESLREFVLQVEGITCGACVHRIEKGLLKLPGVRNASVSIATNSALIRVDRLRSYADVC